VDETLRLAEILLSTGLNLAWAFGCARTIFYDIQIPDPCVQALEYFLRGMIPALVEGITITVLVFYEYRTALECREGLRLVIEWYQSWFELQWTMWRGLEGVFI